MKQIKNIGKAQPRIIDSGPAQPLIKDSTHPYRPLIGKIVAFDRMTCRGEAVYDLSPVRFHSTCFQGRGWPRVGQKVEIVFNAKGELISLHEVT